MGEGSEWWRSMVWEMGGVINCATLKKLNQQANSSQKIMSQCRVNYYINILFMNLLNVANSKLTFIEEHAPSASPLICFRVDFISNSLGLS